MFRNREIRWFAVYLIFITAALAAAGFAIHPLAGYWPLSLPLLLERQFFVFTRSRYKSIAQISEQIDLVLHNADHLLCQRGSGRRTIHSAKRDHQDRPCVSGSRMNALKGEKKHLADSLADIAHQLRTPLTSANLILSLLKNTSDENERKNLLREVEGLFVQMDWLVTSLLKLSRLDAGIVVFQREQMDVGNLIDASIRPLLISMELHNIDLQTDIPEGIVIEGDSGWPFGGNPKYP